MKATRVTHPPPKQPLMIYDGDCNFCRFWIGRWRERTGRCISYRRQQQVAERFPEIPKIEFQRAVQFIEPNGAVSSGADAIFRSFDLSKTEPLSVRLARKLPGFGSIASIVYRFIAKHRETFSFFTRALWGRSFRKPKYLIARWVFLRLLGAVYFIAFISLLVQLRGLIGRRGILPTADYLDAARSQLGSERYRLIPTIFWWNASDAVLIGSCIVGAALSVALFFNVWPGVCLVLLWALYLSFVTISRTFFGYQWDVLLLEASFLSIFLVPLSFRPDWRANALSMRVARGLLVWLVFRLILESGIVKLTSGDPTWRNLTALKYHYETQPLPIWTAWYFNQSSLLALKISALVMFAIEFGAPFTVIAPARVRRAGCAAMIALQGMIAATGNYCFFNLLTASLCVLVLDDDAWPKRWRQLSRMPATKRDIAWPLVLIIPVAMASVLLTGMRLVDTLGLDFCWPEIATKMQFWLAPFRSFNGYGLFAVMTTERPEIIIEGSNDLEHWLPYEFKWKPGDITRRPQLVAPHQPRLDWQMWFAALGSVQDNWFQRLLLRLLEGSPEVLSLLGKNPFPDAPPRYIRAQLYEYHFTRSDDVPRAWWKREPKGIYYPTVSLRATPPGQ